MQNLRVAVDVGGTFTDICIMDETTGLIRIEKTASTPDPIDGIMAGICKAAIDLSKVALFSHGTTVATNALITRRLPRTAMVCTKGFRDVIEIRRANKEELWDAYKDVVKPYVPRRDRLTVPERVDAQGAIVTPLDESGRARGRPHPEAAQSRGRRGLLHERLCQRRKRARMKQILEEEMPGMPVSTSSGVLPEIFEHERFSTTVVNAALSPVLVDYTTPPRRTAEAGAATTRDLLLLHTGGGVMTPASVKDFAARLAGSGIAAGAIASRYIAMLCGFQNSIGLDMGGTSTDVSLAYEGQSRVTKDWHIEFGYPIRFPSIEVLTIGAGGGSLAWTDEAGSLRNGPQSAGANPGPACYGNGNRQATNTDANVVLGRLGTSLAGGKIMLDPTLAAAAVDEVAASFGLDARGGGGRDHPRRQRQHVGCGAPDLDQPRLRSARFRAGRLRRRRRAAWGGDREGTFDSGRHRAAQSRRHFGARLPAGRHAARFLGKLFRRRRRSRPRRHRGANSASWRPRRWSVSPTRGWRAPTSCCSVRST